MRLKPYLGVRGVGLSESEHGGEHEEQNQKRHQAGRHQRRQSQLPAHVGPASEDTGADVAAKKMLDRLVWWGEALRTARDVEPYAA